MIVFHVNLLYYHVLSITPQYSIIHRLLSQNPSLLQLYKDLVITQVLTADEFWAKHAAKFMQKQKAQAQEIGVSGAFLVRNFNPLIHVNY